MTTTPQSTDGCQRAPLTRNASSHGNLTRARTLQLHVHALGCELFGPTKALHMSGAVARERTRRSAICCNNFAVAACLILQNTRGRVSLGDNPDAYAPQRLVTLLQLGRRSGRATNSDAVVPVAAVAAGRETHWNLICRTDTLEMALRETFVTTHPLTCDHAVGIGLCDQRNN
jgi:hypothetical protein